VEQFLEWTAWYDSCFPQLSCSQPKNSGSPLLVGPFPVQRSGCDFIPPFVMKKNLLYELPPSCLMEVLNQCCPKSPKSLKKFYIGIVMIVADMIGYP
jgi:hypothetical protein